MTGEGERLGCSCSEGTTVGSGFCAHYVFPDSRLAGLQMALLYPQSVLICVCVLPCPPFNHHHSRSVLIPGYCGCRPCAVLSLFGVLYNTIQYSYVLYCIYTVEVPLVSVVLYCIVITSKKGQNRTRTAPAVTGNTYRTRVMVIMVLYYR